MADEREYTLEELQQLGFKPAGKQESSGMGLLEAFRKGGAKALEGVQKYVDSPFTGAVANAVEGKNPIGGAIDSWGKTNSLENSRRIDKAISPPPGKATLLPLEQNAYKSVPPQAMIGALFNRDPEARVQGINLAASPTNLLPPAGRAVGVLARASKSPAAVASVSKAIHEAVGAGGAALGQALTNSGGGAVVGYAAGKALAKLVASPAAVEVGLKAGAIPLHVVEKVLGQTPKAITPLVVEKLYQGLNTPGGQQLLMNATPQQSGVK
jgi:hypothetical protein